MLRNVYTGALYVNPCAWNYKHESKEKPWSTQREKIHNDGSWKMEVSEVGNEGQSSGATRRGSMEFDDKKSNQEYPHINILLMNNIIIFLLFFCFKYVPMYSKVEQICHCNYCRGNILEDSRTFLLSVYAGFYTAPSLTRQLTQRPWHSPFPLY